MYEDMSGNQKLVGRQFKAWRQKMNGLKCPDKTKEIVTSIKDIRHILKHELKRGGKKQKRPSEIEAE